MSSSESTARWAALARDTNETKIQLALNLDGGAFPPETDSRLTQKGPDGHASQASKSQTIIINTGIGFLDHMLHALAKHSGWSLALACQGDLHSKRSDNSVPSSFRSQLAQLNIPTDWHVPPDS
jgi:imidazoleglycerol-phosphate dehydratase